MSTDGSLFLDKITFRDHADKCMLACHGFASSLAEPDATPPDSLAVHRIAKPYLEWNPTALEQPTTIGFRQRLLEFTWPATNHGWTRLYIRITIKNRRVSSLMLNRPRRLQDTWLVRATPY